MADRSFGSSESVDTRRYLAAIRRDLPLIAAVTIGLTVFAFALSLALPKTYSAAARIGFDLTSSSASDSATMDRLIRDLLDANRLERGAIAVHPRTQPLHPLVVDVLETFRPAAESRRIALAHEVPDDLAVHADRDRMPQVMFNLVGNALKFTPDGGQVAVRAARGEREVAVTVADTGAGIPAEDLPHVFERYFTSDGVRGTGLGLFISKEIVAAHGGRISVDSTPGRGARFTFTVPAAS